MFRTRVSVGLDIGHYSVKVAIVGPNKRQILNLMETELLPERAFLDDPCGEDRVIEKVKSTLAPMADEKSKYKGAFSATFQGEGAVYRYLELPRLKRDQQETAITSAASKMLTYPTQEASITALPVPLAGKNSQDNGLFLMAFKKSSLEGHGELLRHCGLEVERLEASPIPMLRTLTANHGKFPGEFVALVQAGSRLTTVLIVRDGHPYSAREFPLGGADFTYAFQMGAQSTWQEAERYKRGYDVAAREVPLEPVLDRWLDQVKRSLDSFARSNQELAPRIQRVFLTGGSAALKGLALRLEQYLKISVTVDTWDQLAPPESLRGASLGTFATALGLALG